MKNKLPSSNSNEMNQHRVNPAIPLKTGLVSFELGKNPMLNMDILNLCAAMGACPRSIGVNP